MVMLMSVSNVFLPEIDKESCFECGSNDELHFHHVIPKSRGGTRTVPLCLDCHAKAHNKKMASGKLISEGMRRSGKILGNWRRNQQQYGYRVEGDKLVEDEREQEIINLIISLRKRKLKYREISEILENKNITNRSGNPFSQPALFRIWKKSGQYVKTIDIERQDGYAYVNQ
jgi:hypothetical protein